jgi:hypothetical protein
MGSTFQPNPAAPPADQGQVMGQQGISEPTSIRDYLALAKEGAARFTNIPSEQAPGTMYMPEQPQPNQAIPESQASDYEKLPFSTRANLSPYIRAKERVRTMLPQLWEQMFPGMQRGATLDEIQMKEWTGAVQYLTGNLLKQYDTQYGAAQKLKKEGKAQRLKDQQYWQKDFWKQKQMGRPITDSEGLPISEAQYVEDRMSASDEMKIKDELRAKGQTSESNIATERFNLAQMGKIFQNNPDLKHRVVFQIKQYMQRVLGTATGADFNAAYANPEYRQLKADAIRDTMMQFNDEILRAARGPVAK